MFYHLQQLRHNEELHVGQRPRPQLRQRQHFEKVIVLEISAMLSLPQCHPLKLLQKSKSFIYCKCLKIISEKVPTSMLEKKKKKKENLILKLATF